MELRVQRHNWLHIYVCNIYDMMPSFMMCNETLFRMLRNNFVNVFLDFDDHMSTASSIL